MLFAQLSIDGFHIYPAMFEIKGDVPEPIVDAQRRLGRAGHDRP